MTNGSDEGPGRRWLSWMLMCTAGATDAIGFLLFAGLYVSFMSGDATQTGLQIGQWDPPAIAKVLAAQVLFVVGAALGHVVQLVARRRRRVVLLLGIAVLLLACAATGSLVRAHVPGVGLLLAFVLAVLAMGAQNSVMHQESGTPVGTMVTGTLVRLGEAIVERAAGRQAPIWDDLGQWLFFVAGAASGTVLFVLMHGAAFIFPGVLSGGLALLLWIRTDLTRRGAASLSNAL